MIRHSGSPRELVSCIRLNSGLIRASVRREIVGRYKGSFLGLFWSLVNPLLMLFVYTFVFGNVFGSKWAVGNASQSEFALILFSGLMIFNLYAECTNRAAGLIVGNPNFVKKVVYPLDLLPLISFFSALYHMAVSLIIWVIVYILLFGQPKTTIFLLPMILVPFGIFIMGISWILASIGVYLRDVSQIIGVVNSALLFISPVFFPSSSIPDKYKFIVNINPLASVIENCRDLMYWGTVPDLTGMLYQWIFASIVGLVGYWWFQKTRMGFSDVI